MEIILDEEMWLSSFKGRYRLHRPLVINKITGKTYPAMLVPTPIVLKKGTILYIDNDELKKLVK